MLLVAVGSGTAPVYRNPTPPDPYGSVGGCDNWLAEDYFYYTGIKYKAAYHGNGTCYRSGSNESQQAAIEKAKAYCEKDGRYCYLLAVDNRVYGYLRGEARSKYSGQYLEINQNYTGENKVCNSTVPGGCVVH